jgi:dihydrodipicolinate synthase/N-acetylneuraminate lyase
MYLSHVDKMLTIPVNGTSGEGMSMTVDERKAVTEAWAAAVKETMQVLMVHVGGACLKDVQELVIPHKLYLIINCLTTQHNITEKFIYDP